MALSTVPLQYGTDYTFELADGTPISLTQSGASLTGTINIGAGDGMGSTNNGADSNANDTNAEIRVIPTTECPSGGSLVIQLLPSSSSAYQLRYEQSGFTFQQYEYYLAQTVPVVP